MKIYLDNYNINNLANKMPLIKKNFIESETSSFFNIYSEDGIFKVDDNKMKKMNIISNKVYKSPINAITVDESVVLYEDVNYLPYDHICNKTTQFVYKINTKSRLKLVIDGTYVENHNNLIFVPTDFYFETNMEEKIYNPIIKDDLNVFLSSLN